MDYQQLKTLLPKPPQKWGVGDVEVWLRFIGLENLVRPFKQHAIDGSCILALEQQDLKGEMNILSGIVVKKIMAWIRTGLVEFEQYLLSQNSSEQTYKNIRNELLSFEAVQGEKEAPTLERKEFQDDSSSSFGSVELILEQTTNGEISQKTLVPKEGLKIGRNSSNDLVITEAEVSRNHAEIVFHQGNFYLKDLASTTGTFIKIADPIEIKAGNIIEIGSHLLQIQNIGPQRITLSMVSEEGEKFLYEKPWNIKGEIGIGRKLTNDIIIEDDSHMSNNHALIYCQQGRYYYKDMSTTNGSWFRLSNEASISTPYELKPETVFKVGPTTTYVCKVKYIFPEPVEVDEKLNCAICYVNTRDCVIQPCNHSNTCMKCCKNLKECPICRIKIDQTLKIYHF